MKKRGQITTFIIIGLLLLIGFALFFALRERAVVVEKYKPKVAEVPVIARPISDFVTNCLAQTAEQGLRFMGDRGGHLELRAKINPAEPTEGEAVQLAPTSELAVPYWWHLKSPNDCAPQNCVFDSKRPPLLKSVDPQNSIEANLDRYVESPDRGILACVGNFEQFRQQGFDVKPGVPKANTVVTKKNVFVELNYPLEITRGEETFKLENFVAELDVNLYEMYELATNLSRLQADQSYLEKHLRNVIDVFSRADPEALPPVSELEFDYSPSKFWIKMEVAQKLKGLLASYTPLLQVHNTRSYRFIEAPANVRDAELYEILYNRGMLIPLPELYPELNVRFAYLDWWKPYFEMNCRGQLCRAEGFVNTLGFLFGIKRYAFTYDVSWPVLVDITNPDAFNGRGYSFKFMLEGNLRNNVPLKTLGAELKIPQLRPQTSLLCEPSQRTSGNITIVVKDDLGRPVRNADVIYVCGTETCGVGLTNDEGRLTTKFPRCLGGFVSANAFNYYPDIKPLDVVDESTQQKQLVLLNYREVNVTAKKYLMKKGLNWQPDFGKALSQEPTERTIIMLDRQTKEFEEPFTTVAEVCGGPVQKARIPCGDPPSDTSKNVRLLPGTYNVTIYSFNYPEEPIRIMPQRRCYDAGPFKKDKCFCIPKKPITFNQTNPLYSGFAQYEWTVTTEELENANQIEFYYLNFALDKVSKDTTPGCVKQRFKVIEDLDTLANLNKHAEANLEKIIPTIYRK